MRTPPDSRILAAAEQTLVSSRRCLRRIGERLRRSDSRLMRTNDAISRTIMLQLETRDRTDAA